MSQSANLLIGFGAILLAAVAGGAFGLQYRVMRRFTVENTSLVSLFFATIVVLLQRVLSRWTARNAQTMKDTSIDTLTAVN